MPIACRVALVLLACLLGGMARAAPSSDLWPRWTAHDPAATATIDHAPWDRVIQAYRSPGADGIARFAYARVSAEDRTILRAYLAALAAAPISRFGRDEQRAYWINLYNALTVQVILDHPGAASIRDINLGGGLFVGGPWRKKLVTIEGEGVSLDDIEHRILRPIWRDPRIHYAVNCASLGCPDLAPRAFTASNSEAQLDAGARALINHPRGARVEGGKLIVSSIYDWFREDFGGTEAGVIAHLLAFAQPPLAAALQGCSAIDRHEYDWRLNAP